MKIKVLRNEGKELDLEFEARDLTLPDLIASELLENQDVAFSGVSKDHPETGRPVLHLRTTKKKPADALVKSLEGIEEKFTKIKSALAASK